MSLGHHHDHEPHQHAHYHLHSNESSTKIVVLISFVTMLLELYYGYKVHSVALTMDGWHMLSHVLVLMLAWAAYIYVQRRDIKDRHRLEHRVLSLSAFASSLLLIIVTALIIYESIEKLFHLDIDVSDGAMLVAVIGLCVNGISAYFLHREEEKMDLNLRAAYLHVLSDVVISAFAIISLLAARYFGLKILDPICGLMGAAIIMKWAAELIRKSWKEVLGG